MISRRNTFKAAAGIAAATAVGIRPAQAADKVLKIGINLSFTGADAENANRIANGAVMAFDEANAAHTVKGYTFQYGEVRRRNPHRRPIRPGPSRHQRPQHGLRQGLHRRHRPADVRRRQGHGPHPQPGQPAPSSPPPPPTPTSPTPSSPAQYQARPARPSTSAPSPPTPSRAPTWPTTWPTPSR